MTNNQIIKIFGGRLVGKENTKQIVSQTIQKLSEAQQEYITHNIWLLSNHPDSWAFAFHGDDLKNQHLIFLSDELLTQSDRQIIFTILHEFGHILLGHKNSIEYKQSKNEISKQEKEANKFALSHLSNF